MRDVLSAVFSTRAETLVDQQEKVEISMALMARRGKDLEEEIERLNSLVHERRTDVGLQERKLEEMRDRRSDVDLEHEKAGQRAERLQDQIKALEERKTALTAERIRAVEELGKNAAERELKTVQLSGIDEEKRTLEEEVAKAGLAVSDRTNRRNDEE